MRKLKYCDIEELEDKYLGKLGTQRRDAFEEKVNAEIKAYHIGEAIKSARKEKKLTQEELGELMGVKKAQVSRIESGQSYNISTVARAFKAMGLHVNLEIEGGMRLALW
ncbi:MAG: helix-turn-helix domain-containing protein [Muribaculaceae bacterium]|nr:helix-turn-helix transcriptional regulator [Bacteroides sp.]MDE5847850.1 helix-turn-helix domain-containing protein [Muribaculaceae bacterium]MDE6192683.1 helix-turn-helix domain-containing protein [Muribaculaceae bacterium]MDE6857084.1 helix-turn-helix domain-containing protein [Muribaculaceae bacterium]